MQDIRDEIFRDIATKKIHAAIKADDKGIIAETGTMKSTAGELELQVEYTVHEGSLTGKDDIIAQFCGFPKQLAMAEERLIGLMAKPSGIATAARSFIDKAGPNIQIVSGAWKKIHISQKEVVRRAVTTGGAKCRICNNPFLYIDKNYVKMLGGIKESLETVNRLTGYVKVIQIEGRLNDICMEACEAAKNKADIIFIDNGNKDDINNVSQCLLKNNLRDKVKLAFAGNIKLADMDTLKGSDVDILDIGRAVIDAPLLDMRMEILDMEDCYGSSSVSFVK